MVKQALLALTTIIVVASLATVATYASFVDTETSTGNTFQGESNELILENPAGIGDTWDHSVLRTWHYENMYPSPERMEPGDILTSHVKLKAFGDSEGDHVDIKCVIDSSEPGSDTDAENFAENDILITNGGGVDNDGDGSTDEDNIDGIDNDGDGLIDEDPDPATGPVPTTANRGVYDKHIAMIITSMTYHTVPIIWSEYSYNGAFFTDTSGDGRISLDEFEAQGLQGLTPVPNSAGEISFFMTVKFADGTWNEYQGDETMMTLIFALIQ